MKMIGKGLAAALVALALGASAAKADDDVRLRLNWLRNRLHMERDRVEREMLERTLNQCNGNRTQAAKVLGISRKTIQNKIKEFGLD